MKKYSLPRLFQIPRSIFTILLRHSFSLCIIVSSKNISYPGFSKYLEFTILLRRSFSLRIIIVSWKKTFTILLHHSFSLCIIVSWKNISYPGFFNYRAFTILIRHSFSLRIIVSWKYLTQAFWTTSHLLYYYIILLHFVSSYHRIMKKYSLPRLFQIPRSIFTILLRHSFSLCIIVSSKNISYPGFSKYLAFTILLCHSFSLRIIVASYHEKIYLTQVFQIPRIYYIITSFFFTSYHRFMKKYILYKAFPNTSHLLLLRHSFSLHIIISWKNISHPGFSKFLAFTTLLRRSFSLRIIVSWKNILPRLFQIPRIYYFITSFFFALYHRIMKKHILPRLFQIPCIYYYYVILFHFVSSFHEKIYLTQAFPNTSNLLYYYVVLFHFVSSSYHEKRHLLYYYVILFHFVSSYHEKIYLTQDFSTTAHLLY